jgi:hypothetical protein
MGAYSANRKWRLSHRKLRNKGRKRYYAKHRYGPNQGRYYTKEEQWIITSKLHNGKRITDVELAQLLGRSVQAIQVLRNVLKHR